MWDDAGCQGSTTQGAHQMSARSETIERYRCMKRERTRLGNLADAAFARWFNGETTHAGAATRLQNRLFYLTADMTQVEIALWRMGVDPENVDEAA